MAKSTLTRRRASGDAGEKELSAEGPDTLGVRCLVLEANTSWTVTGRVESY